MNLRFSFHRDESDGGWLCHLYEGGDLIATEYIPISHPTDEETEAVERGLIVRAAL